MSSYLSIFDFLLVPLYILVAIAYGHWATKKNIKTNPEYYYFTKGIIARIIGAMALGLVYYFYYGAGDTTNYFESATAFSNLLDKHPDDFWTALFGSPKGLFSLFDDEAGNRFQISRRRHKLRVFFHPPRPEYGLELPGIHPERSEKIVHLAQLVDVPG